MIYLQPEPDGMSGPFPAGEIPRLSTPGFPSRDDRRNGWRLARRWGGSPELEWSFDVFSYRVDAFSGHVPALFYEPLSDFDATRRLLRLSAHLMSRRDSTAPFVRIGFEYFDRAYLVGDGRLRLPTATEPFRGRHSVQAYDHADLETIMFANSWGQEWGDSGYGYIDRGYFESHVDAVWVTWPAVRGRSPKWVACLRDYRTRRLPAGEQELHCWTTENEFWREDVIVEGEVRCELFNWCVVSWESGRLVDVFELRSSSRILGRLHLHYEADTGVIKELFVVPKARRRGLASLLEQVAVDRCRHYQLDALHIWLGEADAHRLRPAAEAFAEARGYLWHETAQKRPNVLAIATKEHP